MSSSNPVDHQILISRIFEAPRDEVFQAWTDPEQVANWYGPATMEASRESIRIDPRTGGRWELTMVPREGGGDGFSIGYDIIELVEPELLVLRSDPMPEMGMHEPTVTRVEFHDHGDKTRMTLIDGPYPSDSTPAEAGWNSAFDKLATALGN